MDHLLKRIGRNKVFEAKGEILVVEERPNPSTDYYVAPWFGRWGLRWRRCGPEGPPADAPWDGAWVVFVRYIPTAWRRAVAAVRGRLDGLALFMDDDLLDPAAWAGLPLRYRWKLARLIWRHRGWLRRMGAELWVSTPYLQEKYAEWTPRLLPPLPAADLEAPVTVFYHGTASHGAELAWLRPVLAEVAARALGVAFEVVGGAAVRRLYRGVPRLRVVHPMDWESYRCFLAAGDRHVGLVPAFDGPFNRARAYTKFYEITQAGAVGIYSSHSACAEVVTHGREGLVVPMEREAWVAAILELVSDAPRREAMQAAARKAVERLRHAARSGFRR